MFSHQDLSAGNGAGTDWEVSAGTISGSLTGAVSAVAAGCSTATGSAGSSSGGNVNSCPHVSAELPAIPADARRGMAADAPSKRRHTAIILNFMLSPAFFSKFKPLIRLKNIF
jgi:hypothetical protein